MCDLKNIPNFGLVVLEDVAGVRHLSLDTGRNVRSFCTNVAPFEYKMGVLDTRPVCPKCAEFYTTQFSHVVESVTRVPIVDDEPYSRTVHCFVNEPPYVAECPMSDLMRGYIFYMEEPDGDIVCDDHGYFLFVVTQDVEIVSVGKDLQPNNYRVGAVSVTTWLFEHNMGLIMMQKELGAR